jgi:hypothetical protein
MKQIIVLALLLFVFFPAHPQVKIGISVQPGILANRVSDNIDAVSAAKDGSKPKLWLGIHFEKVLNENNHLLTGLNWAPKRFGMRLNDENGQRTLNVKMQYVQVPVMLKLYTDEIALDKKLYFQVGPTFDFKVYDTSDASLEDFYINKINFWDVSLHFGGGMDFRVGYNTRISGGIAYYRGLVNAIIPESSYKGDLRVKNDFYALNVSIHF